MYWIFPAEFLESIQIVRSIIFISFRNSTLVGDTSRNAFRKRISQECTDKYWILQDIIESSSIYLTTMFWQIMDMLFRTLWIKDEIYPGTSSATVLFGFCLVVWPSLKSFSLSTNSRVFSVIVIGSEAIWVH